MARGQAPFRSEWLGRIRIWQWPLVRHFAGWFHTLIWISMKKDGMIDARGIKSWVMVLSLSETTTAQTQHNNVAVTSCTVSRYRREVN